MTTTAIATQNDALSDAASSVWDDEHALEVVCAEVPSHHWDTVRGCWAQLSEGLAGIGACERTETFHTRAANGDVLAIFAVVWSNDEEAVAVHGSDYSLDRMLRALGLPDRVDLQLLRRFPSPDTYPVARSA